MSELKPCVNVLCQSDDIYIEKINIGLQYRIGCNRCFLKSMWFFSEQEAIEAWNNRPETAWDRHQRLLLQQKYLVNWLYYVDNFGLPKTEIKAHKRMDMIEKEIKDESKNKRN